MKHKTSDFPDGLFPTSMKNGYREEKPVYRMTDAHLQSNAGCTLMIGRSDGHGGRQVVTSRVIGFGAKSWYSELYDHHIAYTVVETTNTFYFVIGELNYV